MRVLLDANILISYLLPTRETSPVRTMVRAAIAGRYTLLLHERIVAEVMRSVAAKPYLTIRITPEEVELLFELLGSVAELIPTISDEIPPVIRDPKDDYLLAYALVGEADYLVTGDDDLLMLDQVESVKILRPVEFARLLREEPGGVDANETA